MTKGWGGEKCLRGIFFFEFWGYIDIMMKGVFVFLNFILGGCVAIAVPDNFVYEEIQTRDFKIASWQKVTNLQGIYKIYIEGDGYAFNANGQPTRNPTPRGTLVRELAFGDDNENVIYLARPCQYVKSPNCSKRHWTSARFAPEVIIAMHNAIKQIAGENPVVLVGFSGGAQVAGLVSSVKTGLNVKKVITVAGNLDHLAWTEYHNLPPLNESMNLESYRKQFARFPQLHYVGSKDEIIPPSLVREFVQNDDLVEVVPDATHNQGWDGIYPKIWAEN